MWSVGDGEVDDRATDAVKAIRGTCELSWHQIRIEDGQGGGGHVVGKHLGWLWVTSGVEIEPVCMAEVEVPNQYHWKANSYCKLQGFAHGLCGEAVAADVGRGEVTHSEQKRRGVGETNCMPEGSGWRVSGPGDGVALVVEGGHGEAGDRVVD
jgi:hypothetical protein